MEIYLYLSMMEKYFIFIANKFAFNEIMSTFALTISRGGAVVARWAHNPKVISSSLVPAT